MTPPRRLRRLLIAGWACSLVLLLVLGAILLRGVLGGSDTLFSLLKEAPPEPDTEREVLLYFAAPGAEGLQAESITIPVGDNPTVEIRTAVEAIIAGSRRGLTPTVDSRVKLLNVYIVERLAVLDFSAELQTTHAGGSINELLTIYSLVNTVTGNFSDIAAVQLLVEGEEIDTLSGHVDTRHPFRANPDWILPGLAS